MSIEKRKLSRLRLTDQLQSRARIDMEAVAEYSAWLRDHPTQEMAAIVVFDDLVADGFHRKLAYDSAGRVWISALCLAGGERAALLYSCGANAEHGVRRTNADKLLVVRRLLADEEWRPWSDRRLAGIAHVSPTFVSAVRASDSRFQMDARRVQRGDGEYIQKVRLKPAGKSRDPSIKRVLAAIVLLGKQAPNKFLPGLTEPQRTRLHDGTLLAARTFLDSL